MEIRGGQKSGHARPGAHCNRRIFHHGPKNRSGSERLQTRSSRLLSCKAQNRPSFGVAGLLFSVLPIFSICFIYPLCIYNVCKGFPYMIVTIGTTKGGVGKSTIAVNLAIGLSRCGFDVLLIDGDSPQETALAFTQL